MNPKTAFFYLYLVHCLNLVFMSSSPLIFFDCSRFSHAWQPSKQDHISCFLKSSQFHIHMSPTVSALSLTLEDPCQGGFHSYVVTCLSFFLSVYLACQALATSFSHITKIISRGHERHTHSTLPFLLSVGVMITIWMGPWASSGLIWRLPSLQFRPLFSDPEDRRSLLVQCNHVSRKSVFLCISCMLVPWLPCAYSSDAHLHPACMARCDVLRVYGMKL